MKKITLLFSLLIAAQVLKAQDFNYTKTNDWKEQPDKHTVHAMFDSSGAIGILDDRKIEIKTEKDNVVTYYTVHNIFKIKNDKGIEMYNKVYIYMPPNATISDLKARAILASGKIINVDAFKAKEIVEEGRRYKLFAIDGVEKNSEVEYRYTIKKAFSLFGSETMQGSRVPYQESYFTLITPKYLKFSAKGYNGYKVSIDSLINDNRIIVGYDNDVKKMEDEKYAYNDQYLKRVDYKLSYNLSNSTTTRLYTWKEFGKKAFSAYTDATEKEQKQVNNYLKQIKLPEGGEAAKIVAIEDFVKTNINVDENLVSDEAENIEKIIKNKASDNKGITRLCAIIFDNLGIAYQLVFPGNRDGYGLDEDLENWNRADNALFYFPSVKKYIDPAASAYRYPYVPYNYTASKALFLKGTKIGDFKTAIATFGEVEMEPFEQHAHNMDAEVSFLNNDTVLIKSKQIFTGYGATGYRPAYTFLPKDKLDEFNKNVIQGVVNSNNISNIKIENAALTDCVTNKPLIIGADIKSTDLIENAGNKILFKIGEIIGPQAEMYQEKARQLPMELSYPHILERNIVFHVPQGYQVLNANSLNINIVQKENDVTTMGFVSSYTLNGSDLIVHIVETYHNLRYPIEAFDKFKNVINAAADFNKIVLVLQKK